MPWTCPPAAAKMAGRECWEMDGELTGAPAQPPLGVLYHPDPANTGGLSCWAVSGSVGNGLARK